ncbi:MAG: symmetrical bis(5'-nucleosyl)-tetraphosphatase [Betaproteobacteria bacterium]|nr:symmetrical bis(5'-nucleosyl)-tetraphosphatase [Betaproteobacteria bacterium]NBY05070.1 symmetrical bis(5'-nucleosyl)-tetraphosphatase [Betaproteobacteria bacterium]
MALYLIGDVQGCDAALHLLLQHIDFSPSRDQLVLLGDLVNRGPSSAAVLRRVVALQGAALCVLGNHDLHALAVAHGVRPARPSDTLNDLLQAQDSDPLLQWLRMQPLALHLRDCLMVHAGVLPSWGIDQTLALAAEVQAVLRTARLAEFLPQLYGNSPAHWSDQLQGVERWRCIVNALTRLRFCSPQGVMDFSVKEGAQRAPKGLMPWFDVPKRLSSGTRIAFGHWSTLGWLEREDVACLDTGCVWGGMLTALELRPDGRWGDKVQVPNPDRAAPLS